MQEKATSRKEKAIVAWRRFQIQTRVETKATESQHQEGSMRRIVVHCSTAAEHRRSLAYLHVKQNYTQ